MQLVERLYLVDPVHGIYRPSCTVRLKIFKIRVLDVMGTYWRSRRPRTAILVIPSQKDDKSPVWWPRLARIAPICIGNDLKGPDC